jgi:hypothetical protein
VLLEIGAAWTLEKPIMPVVTRRDVLNEMPASLEGSPHILELADVETRENEDKFLDAFDAFKETLAAVHLA